MASKSEKARRIELRRDLGNRRFSTDAGARAPAGPAYLIAHACFSCRRSFKTESRKSGECSCPECGGQAYMMGRSFRASSKSDAEQWRKEKALFAHGFRFYSYRSRECVPLPKRYADVDRFVVKNPDHPFRVGEMRRDLMAN